jgi:hypothetical protein
MDIYILSADNKRNYRRKLWPRIIIANGVAQNTQAFPRLRVIHAQRVHQNGTNCMKAPKKVSIHVSIVAQNTQAFPRLRVIHAQRVRQNGTNQQCRAAQPYLSLFGGSA